MVRRPARPSTTVTARPPPVVVVGGSGRGGHRSRTHADPRCRTRGRGWAEAGVLGVSGRNLRQETRSDWCWWPWRRGRRGGPPHGRRARCRPGRQCHCADDAGTRGGAGSTPSTVAGAAKRSRRQSPVRCGTVAAWSRSRRAAGAVGQGRPAAFRRACPAARPPPAFGSRRLPRPPVSPWRYWRRLPWSATVRQPAKTTDDASGKGRGADDSGDWSTQRWSQPGSRAVQVTSPPIPRCVASSHNHRLPARRYPGTAQRLKRAIDVTGRGISSTSTPPISEWPGPR